MTGWGAFGEEFGDLLCKPWADSFHFCNLRGGRAFQPGDGSEVLEKDLLPVLRNSRAIVEDTFRDAPLHEELMEGICESMGLIADALQEAESAAVFRQRERDRTRRPVDFLKFLGQADNRKVVEAEALEFLAGSGKLALAAIDDDEVRETDGGGNCGLRIGSPIFRPPRFPSASSADWPARPPTPTIPFRHLGGLVGSRAGGD